MTREVRGRARESIVALDRAHLWHPYTAADDWEREDPIVVARARGAWIEDVDGTRYLDGNSSWWVSALGHNHPRLVSALRRQSDALCHVALAGTTHEPAAHLARELTAVAPAGLTRAFFTDDGSTAVEAAVKMALQYFRQRGMPEKRRFLALDGAFHGETLAAASLGGIELFRRPFGGVLFDCVRAPLPEEGGHGRAFDALLDLVRSHAHELAAVVVEPLVQGALGMRMYAPALLSELARVARENDVLLVADEVFTGFGRTGPMFACEHAGVTPDLLCLGKALCPLLPLGATLATEAIYDGFRGDRSRAFLYGHTFAGNPLGTAVAREVLAIFRDERVLERGAEIARRIARAFTDLTSAPGVRATRTLGCIGAADLAPAAGGETGMLESSYLGARGWTVYELAKEMGAYLRPLGDTVYVCPPLTIDDDDLDRLLAILDTCVRRTGAMS